MQLFYFHLRGPGGLERDEIGVECTDLDAAYLEVCRAIPGLSGDLIRKRLNPLEHAFEIADADDMLLLDVPFTETLSVRRPSRPLPSSVLQPISQAERAYQLVASVRDQVETLQMKMQAARALLETSRTLLKS